MHGGKLAQNASISAIVGRSQLRSTWNQTGPSSNRRFRQNLATRSGATVLRNDHQHGLPVERFIGEARQVIKPSVQRAARMVGRRYLDAIGPCDRIDPTRGACAARPLRRCVARALKVTGVSAGMPTVSSSYR